MSNLTDLMKLAKKMQENMKQTQQEMEKLEVTGAAGAGLVTISINGLHQASSVHLDPSILNEPIEVIQTLILSAFNDAIKKTEKFAEQKVMTLAKDFKLPSDSSAEEA